MFGMSVTSEVLAGWLPVPTTRFGPPKDLHLALSRRGSLQAKGWAPGN